MIKYHPEMPKPGCSLEVWINLRIAVIGPTYPFRGGISHYTTLLGKALAESHQVLLISFTRQYPKLLFPGKTQTDDSYEKIEIDGAEQVIDSINPFSWLRAARKIRNFNPELVIFQWWHPFFAPAFGFIASRCRKFAKIMFLCHNVVPHEKARMLMSLTGYALSKGNMFIVHSEEDASNLKSLLPDARVRKARHPSYEVFGQRHLSKEDARRELGLSLENKVILFFGLVREYKGLRYLIEAMPSILSEVNATLLIAGEFYDNRDSYINLIKQLNLGYRTHLKDEYIPNEAVALYFASADLVVLPYISATQSGIVQIAYAFDRPVITTNVGGLPEAVKNGETGYIVPPADPAALARAIIRFFSQDKEAEFMQNIKDFRKEFSWDRLVKTIEEFTASGEKQCI